jgi:signal transduction histidine kinase
MPTVRLLGLSEDAAARVREAIEAAAPEVEVEEGIDEGSEAARMLAELRQAVGDATHAVNNPLTVISGNAQLAVELARVMEVDAAVLAALQEIDQATASLSETLLRLDRLKQQIADQTGR